MLLGAPASMTVCRFNNHYPRSQEHFLAPSTRRHTHPFGGSGVRKGRNIWLSIETARYPKENSVRPWDVPRPVHKYAEWSWWCRRASRWNSALRGPNSLGVRTLLKECGWSFRHRAPKRSLFLTRSGSQGTGDSAESWYLGIDSYVDQPWQSRLPILSFRRVRLTV